jgi:hypothetical protein
MIASSLLDTAIGIVFVFLLVSLIASSVNEIILSFLNMRGRMLLEGIKTLLNDDGTQWLVEDIYNHGQVFGLFKGKFNPKESWRDFIPLVGKGGTRNLPSYIPSSNFAMAFLGVLPQAARKAADVAIQQAEIASHNAEIETQKAREIAFEAESARKRADESKDQSERASNEKSAGDQESKAQEAKKKAQEAEEQAAIANAKAEDAKRAADTAQVSLDKARATSSGATPEERAKQLADAFTGLKAVAQALSDMPQTEKMGKPLLTMLETAGNDFSVLRIALENWYNSAMDRVSGWYKYHTQWMLFWIGIVLAVSLNANTLTIVKQLSKNDTLRQSIVAAASQATRPADDKSGQSLDKLLPEVEKRVSNVQSLGIPIGWTGGWPKSSDGLYEPVYSVIGGWLLTAIAISLGAPFWFDLLNKFMVVRSTVKPREKSKEEGSKDKQ